MQSNWVRNILPKYTVCLCCWMITPQNLLCLWSKMIWKASLGHHKSLFPWKVDFLSFKKRQNINLYVEYLRTYNFSRVLSSLTRQPNFTWSDLFATVDKNTNFIISKNVPCKVGISNSLCSGTVKFTIFKVIFAYAIELSWNYFS